MAITTVDGAIAGMQPPRYFFKAVTPILVAGKPQSTWGLAGIPGIGSFDNTLNGVTLSNPQNGQIPWTDPGSGTSYLARFSVAAGTVGQVILCDRLWHNGGYTITSTGVQSSTTPTWPARDINGATSGAGVLLGLEISSAAGAAAPTITVTYTNSGGTGSRVGGFAFPTANSPTAGSFFPIALQAGDVGVQSLQSIQLSASWVSGTMNMVAYRVIAAVTMPVAGPGAAIDLLTSGMPQMFNGSVPFLMMLSGSTTAVNLNGTFAVTQG